MRVQSDSGGWGHEPLQNGCDGEVDGSGCRWCSGRCAGDNGGDDVNEAKENSVDDIEYGGYDDSNNNDGKGLEIGECCAAQSIMISGWWRP